MSEYVEMAEQEFGHESIELETEEDGEPLFADSVVCIKSVLHRLSLVGLPEKSIYWCDR